MAAWRYGVSNAEVIESKRRQMMEKRAKGKQVQENGGRAVQRAVTSRRNPMAAETGEAVYGSVASRGGSAIELDPRFTLNVR